MQQHNHMNSQFQYLNCSMNPQLPIQVYNNYTQASKALKLHPRNKKKEGKYLGFGVDWEMAFDIWDEIGRKIVVVACGLDSCSCRHNLKLIGIFFYLIRNLEVFWEV